MANKKSVNVAVTDEDKSELIRLWEGEECLYNTKIKNYHNINKRIAALKRIQENMTIPIDVDQIKKIQKKLRTTFVREIPTKSSRDEVSDSEEEGDYEEEGGEYDEGEDGDDVILPDDEAALNLPSPVFGDGDTHGEIEEATPIPPSTTNSPSPPPPPATKTTSKTELKGKHPQRKQSDSSVPRKTNKKKSSTYLL